MDSVNRTLYIPLYGKSFVSRKNIILHDPKAEEIWDKEGFALKGKSRSKWLAYNMAMRARVFDDWTARMLAGHPHAAVIHAGCGLDSRCLRVSEPYETWYDCDLPDVIHVRKRYYSETDAYHMISLDASDPSQISQLSDRKEAVVVMEGLSMYLSSEQLRGFFFALQEKYEALYILMDVYTVFGAKASKYKNPVNDVGVSVLYGIDDIDELLSGLEIRFKAEHTFTPDRLISELKPAEKVFFRILFTGRMYGKIYRLYELVKERV